MIKVDRCVGNCNTLNDLSNKVCVPNKTENLILIWVGSLGFVLRWGRGKIILCLKHVGITSET